MGHGVVQHSQVSCAYNKPSYMRKVNKKCIFKVSHLKNINKTLCFASVSHALRSLAFINIKPTSKITQNKAAIANCKISLPNYNRLNDE